MAMSKIEWTDKTWNPVIGCSNISPACDHCYAEKMAARLASMPKTAGSYVHVIDHEKRCWNGKTHFIESALSKPLHWRKPCRVFVGSMTDLFHPSTPFKWLTQIFDVMFHTPHITYQILTKRPDRMQEFMRDLSASSLGGWPFPNVWLGVTVENQEYADKRIPALLDTPAAVRFVSIEPMLGPIDLGEYLGGERWFASEHPMDKWLDWVICGGETGHGSRPLHPDWVRDLRDQCTLAGVPFFFKQWGRKAAGHLLDEHEWHEFPTTV